MKKISLLTFTIAASAIIFASCKKKEEINPETLKDEIRQEKSTKVFDFDIKFQQTTHYYNQSILSATDFKMTQDDVIVLFIKDGDSWVNMPYSELDGTQLDIYKYKYSYPGSISVSVESSIGANVFFAPVTKSFRAVWIKASKVSRMVDYDQLPYSQIIQY